MKLSTLKSLSHSFLVLIILFGAQTAFANTGKAFSIKGKVTVNGEPMTLATTLKEGDIIVTEAKSAVKVIMKDGTVLDIVENTDFKISKYAYNADAPEESSSAFSLLGGAFRYVSGLIAKKDPTNVKLTAGTATIGIRGTFGFISSSPTKTIVANKSGANTPPPNTVYVKMSIGNAKVTLPDGSSLDVSPGQIGTLNTVTGATSTAAATPDPIAAAAQAMASNPENAAAAIASMSDADAALVIATLVNNATQLGATKQAVLAAVSKAVASKPTAAVGTAYVTSALSPADAATFAATIKAAAPEQAAAIEAASNSGKTLDPAPSTTSAFNLRQGINADGEEILEVTLDDGTTLEILANDSSGNPLSTAEIAAAIQEANGSPSSP